MLGSPSFHSYRDSTSGAANVANLELSSGLYYEDQSYSVRLISSLVMYCKNTNASGISTALTSVLQQNGT